MISLERHKKMFEYRSTEIKELMAALVQFDMTMEPVAPDKKGNFGEYASLERLTQASKKVLCKYGLRCSQFRETVEDHMYYVTLVCHAPSGQWIRSVSYFAPCKERDDKAWMKLGSMQTYIQRYDLSAMLGIEACEADLEQIYKKEDIEATDNYQNNKPEKPPRVQRPGCVTLDQSDAFYGILKSHPTVKTKILNEFGIYHCDSVKETDKKKFSDRIVQLLSEEKT